MQYFPYFSLLSPDDIPGMAQPVWWPGYRLDDPGFHSSQQQRIILFSGGPSSLLLNGYREDVHRENRSGNEVTTHLHLLPTLRMSGAIPSTCMPSWRRLYLYFHVATLLTLADYMALYQKYVAYTYSCTRRFGEAAKLISTSVLLQPCRQFNLNFIPLFGFLRFTARIWNDNDAK